MTKRENQRVTSKMYYLCLNEKLGIADFQVDNLLNKRSEFAFTKIRRKLK